jgi:hypothetical protein
MLEADIRYKEENDFASQALTQTLPMMFGHRTSALRSRGKLVDHDRFLSQYWPHFPQSLTKKLGKSPFSTDFNVSLCPKTRRRSLARSSVSFHAYSTPLGSLVSLYLGVISGSERTVTFESGYLDRDTYENSNLRSQSKLAGHCSRIYDIFLSYRQRKLELGDFDAAERLVILVLNHDISYLIEY